ncbi:DoxX family protein [Halobaculum sp. MBLA0147]|uniref:DoxX family protein n=1 Tax=Halobaculum sp. MBLA0147 TaxID=3079934 RepID=UPI0035232E21
MGLCLAAVWLVGLATAHVDYVTDGTGELSNPVTFLVGVLSTPGNLALFGAGGLAAAVGVGSYARFRPFAHDLRVARRTMQSYRPYLPWMFRLSVGLPLVGAGFTGYLFTPEVQTSLRLLQIGLGFLLLFGLATRWVGVVGLVVYGWVLVVAWPVPLLALEYVGGFLAIALVGSGQPSADGLFRRLRVTDGTLLNRLGVGGDPLADLVGRTGAARFAGPAVRLALGVQFVYLGLVEKLMQPQDALLVVEKYDLTAVVPVAPEMWVAGAGVTELAVGLLLITGTLTRASASIAFLLFTTTLFGLPDDPVLAHVSLFGLTSALLVTGAGPLSVDRLLFGDEV